jgi:glycerol-3-phosphate dehydrogenase
MSRPHVFGIGHLLKRYGTATKDLLGLVAERPELGEPLEGAGRYLAVEVVYAASHEGALHLDDVLDRRTHISIETFDRGAAAAEPAAKLIADVLAWDDDAIKQEIHVYQARVAAEHESQEKPDDASANAAQLKAPDPRVKG